jgi:hypothetical protein
VNSLFRLLLAIWTIGFLVVSSVPLLTGNAVAGGVGLSGRAPRPDDRSRLARPAQSGANEARPVHGDRGSGASDGSFSIDWVIRYVSKVDANGVWAVDDRRCFTAL